VALEGFKGFAGRGAPTIGDNILGVNLAQIKTLFLDAACI